MTSRRTVVPLLIWSCAALVVALMLVLVSLHLGQERESRIHEEGRQLEASLTASVAALNRNLVQVDLMIAGQSQAVRRATRRDGSVDAKALGDMWRDRINQDVLVRDIVLIDADGRVAASAREATGRLGLQLSGAYLNAVRAQSHPVLSVSEPVLDEATGERMLWLARRLTDDAQRRVLAAAVPVATLRLLLEGSDLSARWVTTLEREDGVLLAAVPPSEVHTGARLESPLPSGALDGRARAAAGRIDREPALLAARTTLYPSLRVSRAVPLQALSAAVDADHGSDWWSAVIGSVLLLALAGVLHAYVSGEMRARAAVESAREGLLRTQATLDHARDAMGDGFILFDAQDRLVSWNRRYLELFPHLGGVLQEGMARVALLGVAAGQFLAESDGAAQADWVAQRLAQTASGRPFTQTLPGGRVVEITERRSEDGGLVCVVRDITAALAAQRELAEARSTLVDALDAMSDGFVVFDEQERLRVWNRRYTELFPYLEGRLKAGMSLDEVGEIATAALWPDATPQERAARKAKRRAERLRASGVSDATEYGGVVVEAIDRRTAEGRLVTLFRDVTHTQAAARALGEARDAAEAGSRAKSRFLAAMSHEIRTPLNAVLGMNGLLLDTPLTEEQRRYVELVGKSGDSLLAIINDILDLSRLEAGRLALEEVEFSLAAAVHDVVSMMSPRAQAKGLALELVGAEDGLAVRGDPSRLRQVLFNLLGNAIKFTERGGVTVTITHRDQGEGRLALTIAVRDTGIGIAPEALAKLFEPFSQAESSTSRRFGGTGLGLSISREIVQLMGGRIEVSSTPGQGSEFRVELALQQAAAALGSTEGGEESAARPGRSLRVLVAEDNGVNQLLIRAMLERMGHHADVVADGVEAVRQVQAAPYDLVLMDMQMPQMDGLDATRTIRALPGEAARVPIIAMTANVLNEDRIACMKAGMNGFVGKPIDRHRLNRAIDEAVSS